MRFRGARWGANDHSFRATPGSIQPELPFGGVSNSEMGKYHGRWGFDAFTNARGVLYHSSRIDPGVRYPPLG
jgi:acyl-CoA reductase-like NAD-dependent aldehyde dehydrogenase